MVSTARSSHQKRPFGTSCFARDRMVTRPLHMNFTTRSRGSFGGDYGPGTNTVYRFRGGVTRRCAGLVGDRFDTTDTLPGHRSRRGRRGRSAGAGLFGCAGASLEVAQGAELILLFLGRAEGHVEVLPLTRVLQPHFEPGLEISCKVGLDIDQIVLLEGV